MPMVPPWAAAWGLHPPPSGDFNEYLDPRSSHYRQDIAAHLAQQRQAALDAQRADFEEEQRTAASLRDLDAQVEAAAGPLEKLDVLIGAWGQVNDQIHHWKAVDLWAPVMDLGIYDFTHEIITVKLGRPLIGPRGSVSADRIPVWGNPGGFAYVERDGTVWQQEGDWPLSKQYVVPRGGQPEFEVYKRRVQTMNGPTDKRRTRVTDAPAMVKAAGLYTETPAGEAMWPILMRLRREQR